MEKPDINKSRFYKILPKFTFDHPFGHRGCKSTFFQTKFQSKALLPADVRLLEIGPHADGLSVELIGLLQSRLVGSDQIGQVYVNVEVVGGHPCGILLPGNYL